MELQLDVEYQGQEGIQVGPQPAEMPAAATSARLAPKNYVFGWPEMLKAVDLPDTNENRRKVERLNEVYSGPILAAAEQGGQRFADRKKLIEWWNNL